MSEAPAILAAEVEIVGLHHLESHPDNPRRGDVSLLLESLQEHGQYRPLVVQRDTGYVLAGNHTLEALRAAGAVSASVVYVDVDDAEAKRILLVDNRTSDRATYETGALVDLLRATQDDFGSLSGTGYDDAALADLIARTEEAEPFADAEIASLVEHDDPYRAAIEGLPKRIVLDFTPAQHAWWIEQAAVAREAHGVATDAELALRLLEKATGVQAP